VLGELRRSTQDTIQKLQKIRVAHLKSQKKEAKKKSREPNNPNPKPPKKTVPIKVYGQPSEMVGAVATRSHTSNEQQKKKKSDGGAADEHFPPAKPHPRECSGAVQRGNATTPRVVITARPTMRKKNNLNSMQA